MKKSPWRQGLRLLLCDHRRLVQRKRFQAQRLAAGLAHAVGQRRVGIELLAIRRDHFLHFRLPGRACQLALERRLGDHFEHDRRCRRCAGRGAEQGDDAAVGGALSQAATNEEATRTASSLRMRVFQNFKQYGYMLLLNISSM